MREDVKKLWTYALRSEEYKQGKGDLRSNDPVEGVCHCCLGVLTDLYVKSHPEAEWVTFKDNPEYVTLHINGTIAFRDSLLPREVVKWAGLTPYDPRLMFCNNEDKSLAWQNDNGKSFKEIADFIEKEF
jgi:hypothetical protein